MKHNLTVSGWSAILIATMLILNQNCSAPKFLQNHESLSTIQPSLGPYSPAENGSWYQGVVFNEHVDNNCVGQLSNVRTSISYVASTGNFWLLRKDCQDIAPIMLGEETVFFTDSSQAELNYEGVILVREGLSVLPSPYVLQNTWKGLENAEFLSGRRCHTAIWTGTKMIVWGGGTFSARTNDGGIYDPLTKSWTATSLTNAPSARQCHTAVWTGSKMIVWGGEGAVNNENSGGIYDPETNTWSAIATAPQGRQWHSAVWTGKKMLVWGGNNSNEQGEAYDFSSNSWTTFSVTGVIGRTRHSAVWTGSEMIIWGGSDAGGVFGDGFAYNPVTNEMRPIPVGVNSPSGRYGQTAVWTGTKMLVWGGWIGGSVASDAGASYDVATNTWIPLASASAPSPRGLPSAVWSGTGMIIWGGMVGATMLSNGGIYFLRCVDEWSKVAGV